MSRQSPFHRLWIVLLFAACLPGAYAQTLTQRNVDPRAFNATQFGERVTLGPEWLFSPGDTPAFAEPNFDDRQWLKINAAQKRLFEYGIRDIQYGWYRIHIHMRPRVTDLMIGLEGVQGSYEVYANGTRIGSNGRMAGQAFHSQARLLAFPVAESLLNESGDLVLAIRFRLNPVGIRGRGTATPISAVTGIYLLSRNDYARDASYADAHLRATRLVLSGLGFLIGLVALGLYAALRRRKEYLAATAYLLLFSGLGLMDVLVLANDSAPLINWIRFAFFGSTYFAVIEFIRIVLGARRSRWLLGLELTVSLSGAVWVPLSQYGFSNYFFGFAAFFAPILITNIVLLALLVRALRAGNREARILLPAVLFEGLYRYLSFFRLLFFFLHWTRTLRPLPSLNLGSYPVDLGELSDLIFLIAILLFLVLRTVGIAQRSAHASAELEAARTVQQVLIPEEFPVIPGFSIQSVYRPFSEVGGDFFQILPLPNDGVLVVIGDVSGKGMPAAMTVSLLVGTVRTLAHYTQSPGDILAAMNVRMLGRSNGGFTTCLVLRADRDHTLTIANAGHIAPHINGAELAVEGGLPLGLVAHAAYAESVLSLEPDTQMTLVTDGVVEARAKSGELLGFERTAALSVASAESIADAAQAFGQDDDITVLTIRRTPEHPNNV